MPIKVAPGSEVDSHFLNPGDFYFGGADCHIHTILGSCIAITLWHPQLKIGGMCHFVLPSAGTPNHDFDGRYLDGAMALFEREVTARRTKLSQYQAKIFGGSNMISGLTLEEDNRIGTKNTVAATKMLEKKGISLQIAHVGESGHRRIAFDVGTGDVWVKHEPLQKFIPDNPI